jgi:uncharacterized protein (DUF885 family)
MTTPFEISDGFTEAWSDLTPLGATFHGVGGRDHLMDDLSPEGHAARLDLILATKRELAGQLTHPDPVQARAARVLDSWMQQKIDSHEEGKWKRDLNHVASPFQGMRMVFDLMPKEGREEWSNIVSRLQGFGAALDGYRASLSVGLDEGLTAAQRQVESVVAQVRAAVADDSPFRALSAKAANSGGDSGEVESAVESALHGLTEFAVWLEGVYLPKATPHDAVGEERYLLGAEEFLGMRIDPLETYAWGWDEVHRLRADMEATAALIDPDRSIDEVIEVLDTDPDRSAPDHESFARFVRRVQETAVDQLSGEHFDVPEELRRVEVNIAPPGGALGAWYNAPSEDFTRPGTIWYAPGERARIPYWQEVSTAYHEGFPGHHLQVGIAMLSRQEISRFHRLFIWYSGSGEGWALYAERLMDELGYFENPEYRLGLLASQLFRATRVVVDIGTQLEMTIPDHAPLHAGQRWAYATAVDYMHQVALQARDMAESEVTRYLGWWGQAIAYKVGEREILKLRDDLMDRDGSIFDRKAFHRRVLDAGAVRLDQLRETLL